MGRRKGCGAFLVILWMGQWWRQCCCCCVFSGGGLFGAWTIAVAVVAVALALPAANARVLSEYGKKDDATAEDSIFGVQPCPLHCTTSEHQHPSDGATARIFYLILVHNERTANDAIFLFRAIRNARNSIVIHYDTKVKHLLEAPHNKSSVLLQEVRECPCGSIVHVDSVHSVEWSRWSMNEPTLWAMELAVTHPDWIASSPSWDVFINLSGDTLPVYNAESMATRIHQLSSLSSSYNFVTSRSCETGLLPTNVYDFPKFWHKRRHYTRDETEPDPTFAYRAATATTTTATTTTSPTHVLRNKTVTIHFGSQWVILQRPFVEWLIQQLNDKHSWPSQFRDYLQKSQRLMTDETFIPTVLMHANNNNDDDDGGPLEAHVALDDTYDFSHTLPVTVPVTGELVLSSSPSLSIRHVRFERMDEHMPTSTGVFPNTQRYQVPESLLAANQTTGNDNNNNNQTVLLEQPKVWGPYFLGVYDLGSIRNSGALFIRKVSALLDPNMVQLLPVQYTHEIPDIHWPVRDEISLTRLPNWRADLQQLKEQRSNARKGQTSQLPLRRQNTTLLEGADVVTDDEEL